MRPGHWSETTSWLKMPSLSETRTIPTIPTSILSVQQSGGIQIEVLQAGTQNTQTYPELSIYIYHYMYINVIWLTSRSCQRSNLACSLLFHKIGEKAGWHCLTLSKAGQGNTMRGFSFSHWKHLKLLWTKLILVGLVSLFNCSNLSLIYLPEELSDTSAPRKSY